MHIDMEAIILASSYVGIFGLMISNGFMPFPSSQVLYILCGYFIATGKLAFLPVVIVGAIGNAIGNVLLFELVRKKGVHYLAKWEVFRTVDIHKIEAVFRKRGTWFLFVGKLLPALKVFVPIAAGIGKVRRFTFIAIMLVSSALWASAFLSIGYIFGKSAKVFGAYAIILAVASVFVVGLFYRYLGSDEIKRELEVAKGE